MIAPKLNSVTVLLWVLPYAALAEAGPSRGSGSRWGHLGRVSLSEIAAQGGTVGEPQTSSWLGDDESRYMHILNSIRGGVDATDAVKSSSPSPSKKTKKKKRTPTSADAQPTSSTASHDTDESSSNPAKIASSSSQPPKKKPKVSKAARAHVARDIKSTSPNYRIQRELKEFIRDPPPGLSVQIGKNLRVWIVTIEGPGIYKGETFRLRVSFPPQYPTVPPSVYFLQPNIPV